jgi:chemotaxis protein MotB
MAKAASRAKGRNTRPIVIRREEVTVGNHHGGAWKVAYADFVTAMMAFFLLMWLINATTEAQRIGLADYFSQANVLNRGASGEGKPFGGSDPFDTGALASNRGTIQVMPGTHQPQSIHKPLPHPQARQPQNGPNAKRPNPAMREGGQAAPQAAQNAAQQAAQAALQAAAQEMRSAIASNPALTAYANQLSVVVTSAGIKIQIIDSHNRPMFALGSAKPAPATLAILAKLAPILGRLGHAISIAGYTDARPYPTPAQNNWLLSVERADATRAALVVSGLPEADLKQVAGYADRDLLHPEDPLADSNRRITITVAKDPASNFGPTQ